jgi:hypothetical protein
LPIRAARLDCQELQGATITITSVFDLLKRFSFVVSSWKGKLKPFLFLVVCPGFAGQD